jgi:uncharacterized membrane protein YhhN
VSTPSRLTERLEATRWWGFWLYATVSVVHVAAIAFGLDAIEYPTKLLLMPTLGIAALWALRGASLGASATLLFLTIAFSWLGDGASFFFPYLDDELPAMLACFGIAHLVYIALFVRHIHERRVPAWTVVYALWWGAMIAVLWPHLGALLLPVIIYGAVLGGTAVASTRGGLTTAIGGAFFLASDTILALRLFLPGVSPDATGPWIMITYAAGQGLLVLGICRLLRRGLR